MYFHEKAHNLHVVIQFCAIIPNTACTYETYHTRSYKPAKRQLKKTYMHRDEFLGTHHWHSNFSILVVFGIPHGLLISMGPCRMLLQFSAEELLHRKCKHNGKTLHWLSFKLIYGISKACWSIPDQFIDLVLQKSLAEMARFWLCVVLTIL